MQTSAKPEIITPRTKWGGKMFDDEHLDSLSHILDDFIQIPGTPIRFGLDGIVGFILWGGGRDRGDCVVHHYYCGVGARSAVASAGADGGERGDRGSGGGSAGDGRRVRYCMAGEPTELRAACRV